MNDGIYPALIIGAGAAGLFAGAILGRKALILEKNDTPGKKLLLTGGGRCNYTHDSSVPELLAHYNGNQNAIKKILYRLPPASIIEFFRKLGIEPSIEDDGKVFPKNGNADDIISALSSKCSISFNEEVESIHKEDGVFTVRTPSNDYRARNVIITAGCSAYPMTGSDGKALGIFEDLGIKTIPFTPALAPIAIERSLPEAEGITLQISIKHGKRHFEGSVVITRKGISGPVAQNASFLLKDEEKIEISFCNITKEEIMRRKGKQLLKNALPIPDRLASAILKDLGSKRIGDLRKDEINTIVKELTAYRTRARAIKSGAMTNYGGAILSEFNPATMEAKSVDGLYVAGDILEPCADCGGYSLTFAFASAYIASDSILDKLE